MIGVLFTVFLDIFHLTSNYLLEHLLVGICIFEYLVGWYSASGRFVV